MTKEMSKKETIILIPSWGMGHIIPFVELAKLFTTTTTPLSVAIIIFDPPYDVTTTIDPFIANVTSSHHSISFHRLPTPSLPPNHLHDGRQPFGFDLLRFSNPQLTEFLSSYSQTFNIRAIIMDMFCSSSLEVARQFHIPAYFFFSCGVSVLAAFASLPKIRSHIDTSFKEMGNTPLPLPSLPPIPASYLPVQLLDDGGEIFKAFMFHFGQFPKADGIIVNSLEAIESMAVKAINDGVFGPMPPVSCVGPLIAERSAEEEKHACLKWLDEQPKGSVVFLCFGSQGSFSMDQINEIATGLERSGQRFLWVLKAPLVGPDSGEKRAMLGKAADPALEELLAEGFLERTKGRGMVVKSWAPQTAVLGHEAVGGFVSHCGWNSVLEAVSAGVVIIGWPMYAEQKMNMVFLAEEKLAVEMEGWEEMVKGEEVEKKVRWLMETEEGKEWKEMARVMRECAVGARKEGGPSYLAWMNFVNQLKEQ